MTRGIIAAVTIAACLLAAAPASAAPPDTGQSCTENQLNSTATNGDGVSIRCLADDNLGYIWMIDTGKKQDPWIAGQVAWNACHQQGNNDAQCRAILNGGTDPLSPVTAAIPGDGTFLVGTDIAPGNYRSGPARGLPCQWWTLRQLGNDDSQTGFDSSDGQTYAVIRPSDASFHTQFCQPWQKVS